MEEFSVVWDLGATNQTVCLVGSGGKIAVSHSLPTESETTSEGVVWPLEKMFDNFCALTREVSRSLKNGMHISGLGISTFGVCWGALDKSGRLVYPVISWKCTRTREIVNSPAIQDNLPWLYDRTGAPPMHFNTLFTLMWMRKHHPTALENASVFLMMPQLFVRFLTGINCVDRAMSTTSMLVNLEKETWDDEIFRKFDLPNKFPREISACETMVGELLADPAERCGLPMGTPVIAGGHDTVVGLAALGRPLQSRAYLSTGTWNLLVSSHKKFHLHPAGHRHSLAWQLNPAKTGLLSGYNHQSLMIGGLALDWVKSNFARELTFDELGGRLEGFIPGASGLKYIPNLIAGTGPYPMVPGALVGIRDGLRAEDYYQAALEGLAFMIRRSRDIMDLHLDEILIGGGLSKSPVFCRILSCMLGVPVIVASVSETTSLGISALIAVGTGRVSDIESAWMEMNPTFHSIEGTPALREAYANVAKTYEKLAEALG